MYGKWKMGSGYQDAKMWNTKVIFLLFLQLLEYLWAFDYWLPFSLNRFYFIDAQNHLICLMVLEVEEEKLVLLGFTDVIRGMKLTIEWILCQWSALIEVSCTIAIEFVYKFIYYILQHVKQTQFFELFFKQINFHWI